MLIYHIATVSDWRAALDHGSYLTSTRDRTLDDVGFIHASGAHQVAAVANRYYTADDDLLLLHIETDLLSAEVRHEDVAGSTYPHIYGPLNPSAVVAAPALRCGPDGTFTFPA